MNAEPREFRFAVINDLHYTDADDGPWLESIVDRINRSDAVLCLVLGDLVEHGTLDQLVPVKRILDRLRMPYYTVPGNHDGPPDRPADTPDPGLQNYETLFPNRRNYTFDFQGWQFIGLDTCNGGGWKNVVARPETLAYARETAARLDPRKPTIVFTHFPIDPCIRFNMLNGPDILAALKPLNIRIVFSGHFHGMTQATIAGVEVVTNRCCSMKREIHDGGSARGYFMCTAHPNGTISRDFVELPTEPVA